MNDIAIGIKASAPATVRDLIVMLEQYEDDREVRVAFVVLEAQLLPPSPKPTDPNTIWLGSHWANGLNGLIISVNGKTRE